MSNLTNETAHHPSFDATPDTNPLATVTPPPLVTLTPSGSDDTLPGPEAPVDNVVPPPNAPPNLDVPNFPPPTYQDAVNPPPVVAALAKMKILKDHEKWLVANVWPNYWHSLEKDQQHHKKGAKKEWCLQNVTDPFRAQFPTATPREVVHDSLYRWCTNRARETRAGKKPVPANPNSLPGPPESTLLAPTTPESSQLGNAVAGPVATTSAVPSNPPATSESSTQSEPGTSTSAVAPGNSSTGRKPRAINGRNLFAERQKTDIESKARARCPGRGGGEYLAARQAVITEMYGELTADERREYEEEAKTANENRMFKPPADHISENQEILVAHVVNQLGALIGDDWGQCGDVAFVVHAIKTSSDSGLDVEMITVTGGTRTGFRIAEDSEEKYNEGFLDPLKKWVTREGKRKETRSSACDDSESLAVPTSSASEPLLQSQPGSSTAASASPNSPCLPDLQCPPQPDVEPTPTTSQSDVRVSEPHSPSTEQQPERNAQQVNPELTATGLTSDRIDTTVLDAQVLSTGQEDVPIDNNYPQFTSSIVPSTISEDPISMDLTAQQPVGGRGSAHDVEEIERRADLDVAPDSAVLPTPLPQPPTSVSHSSLPITSSENAETVTVSPEMTGPRPVLKIKIKIPPSVGLPNDTEELAVIPEGTETSESSANVHVDDTTEPAEEPVVNGKRGRRAGQGSAPRKKQKVEVAPSDRATRSRAAAMTTTAAASVDNTSTAKAKNPRGRRK
ncbi:hypothetical protein PQX77_002823 [Marasmius sp. AFHP31]|nr:hypothetical protein PQX77_002823 [Marasmius sp. AFHP31]